MSAFESYLHMSIAPVRCSAKQICTDRTGAKKNAPTPPTGIERKFAPHRCGAVILI